MRTGFCLTLAAILCLVALAACAPGATTGNAPAAVPATAGAMSTENGSIMPGVPDTGSTTTPNQGASSGGDITSKGQTNPFNPTASSGENQTSPSGQGSNSSGLPSAESTVVTNTTGWKVYRNDPYQFQLLTPPDYIVVPVRPGQAPQSAASIWFQDEQLAKSQTANLQPPAFAIYVYDNAAHSDINDWLSSGRVVELESNAQVTPVQIGGVQGVQVGTKLAMAPDTVYYVANGNWIYQIMLLGDKSPAMLKSLTFTK